MNDAPQTLLDEGQAISDAIIEAAVLLAEDPRQTTCGCCNKERPLVIFPIPTTTGCIFTKTCVHCAGQLHLDMTHERPPIPDDFRRSYPKTFFERLVRKLADQRRKATPVVEIDTTNDLAAKVSLTALALLKKYWSPAYLNEQERGLDEKRQRERLWNEATTPMRLH